MRLIGLVPLLVIGTLAWATPPSQSVQPSHGGGNVSVVHVDPAPPSTPPAVVTDTTAGTPGGTAGAEDDPVAELTSALSAQQKAWEKVNANNPMSASFGQAQGLPGPGGGADPFDKVSKILSNPVIQTYLKFFTNPIFSKGTEQIMNSPKRMTLLYVELGLVVFMLIFRAWRYSKSSHWAARLWTRIWTLAMFWTCSLIVVPWVVLGDPYYQTIRGALDVLMTAKK